MTTNLDRHEARRIPYLRGGTKVDEGPSGLAEEFGAVFLEKPSYDPRILSSTRSGDTGKPFEMKFAKAI